MARIRTIKPEFTQHEDLSALPAETHLFAAGLLNHADDEGYFNANPKLLKASVFPLRECSVSVQEMLTQLSGIGYVRLGVGRDGKRYGQVVKFKEHQRINRPSQSKIQALGIVWEEAVSTHHELSEDSLPEGKGKEGNGTGNGKGSTRALPVGAIPANPDSEERVRRIFQAHPRQVRETVTHQAIIAALVELEQEMGGGEAAYCWLLKRTELYRECVAEWPPGERQFIVGSDRWFSDKRFNESEDFWRRSDQHRAQQDSIVESNRRTKEILRRMDRRPTDVAGSVDG
jgi:hypothetical protein